MSLVGSVGGGVSSIIGGFSQKAAAENNAAAYYAQAQNIQTQKGIVARQYGVQGSLLEGQAIATAGRQGVKVSGTIAQSISASLTELNLQKGYELYNLEVQRVQAINNAKYQEYAGNMALTQSFFDAASSFGSALGKIGESNYFNKNIKQSDVSNNNLFNKNGKLKNKVKFSGGFNFSNPNIVSGNVVNA
jgi:hypothetical protein